MPSVIVFAVACALAFYSLGAVLAHRFLVYGSWRVLAGGEFRAVQAYVTPRLLIFVALPLALGTAFSISLLGFRPSSIPAWPVWLVIALHLGAWVSTGAIQIPLHLKLETQGYSRALVERLILADWWLRLAPCLISAALYFWMMITALRDAGPAD